MKRSTDFARFAKPEVGGGQLRSRSVFGAAALGLGAGGELVVRFLSIMILARLLTPAEFGLVGMVTALTAVAATLGLGLATATVQRREITHSQVSNLFWIGLFLGAMFTLAFCALAVPIAAFYREPRLIPVTFALASTFLIGSCSLQHEALLTRTMEQPRTAGVRLVATSLSVAVSIPLAFAGMGVWALVAQELTRSAAVSGGMWLLCQWRPSAPSRHESVHGFVRFGAEITLAQLVFAVGNNLDKLLVGKLLGPGVLGLYRQAQQLVLVPIEQLNAPIASVAQPGLSLLQDDADRYRRYYSRIVAVIGILTMPVAAFGMVFSRELTAVIFGHNWAGAAPFLLIFAAAAFFRPALGTTSAVLVSLGRSRKLLAMTVVSQVAHLALLVGGAFAGPQAIASAYFVTPALLLVPILRCAFSESPVRMRDFFSALRAPVIASCVMAVALGIFRAAAPEIGTTLLLTSAAVIAAAVFTASFLVLPGGRAEARKLVHDVIESVRHRRRHRQMQAGV